MRIQIAQRSGTQIHSENTEITPFLYFMIKNSIFHDGTIKITIDGMAPTKHSFNKSIDDYLFP